MAAGKTSKADSVDVAKLQAELAAEKEAHRQTKIKLKLREHENHSITQSMSYKVAKLIAKPKHYGYKAYTIARTFYPGRLRKLWANKVYVDKTYASPDFTNAFSAEATADAAVVIHLYYIDMLPLFIDKLQRLKHVDFDLYITITDKNSDMLEHVKQQMPNAHVAVVPNCGRDVLPFVQVMKQIESKGYEYVLKLHSKKSPHRTDGNVWRDKMIDSLVPEDAKVVDKIIKVLRKKDTALFGPTDEYVSTLVNYTSTKHHVERLLGLLVSKDTQETFLRHPDEYGFFAGTMFWARVDTLMPIIDAVAPRDFEPEFGQQDSTLAHALERLFNVVPELAGKKLYELHGKDVEEVAHRTTKIPSWAEYTIDE